MFEKVLFIALTVLSGIATAQSECQNQLAQKIIEWSVGEDNLVGQCQPETDFDILNPTALPNDDQKNVLCSVQPCIDLLEELRAYVEENGLHDCVIVDQLSVEDLYNQFDAHCDNNNAYPPPTITSPPAAPPVACHVRRH